MDLRRIVMNSPSNHAKINFMKGCVVGQMHRKINTAMMKKNKEHAPARA